MFSEEVKRKAWERDGGLCQWPVGNGKCLAPGREFHHRTPKGMGGRKGQAKKDIDSVDNCMTVCLMHHRLRHG